MELRSSGSKTHSGNWGDSLARIRMEAFAESSGATQGNQEAVTLPALGSSPENFVLSRA